MGQIGRMGTRTEVRYYEFNEITRLLYSLKFAFRLLKFVFLTDFKEDDGQRDHDIEGFVYSPHRDFQDIVRFF